MYPLKLEPIYWDSIWGNDKLAKIRKNPKIHGTSWDVSAHPHADNVILNVEYEGKTILLIVISLEDNGQIVTGAAASEVTNHLIDFEISWN